MPTQVPDMSVSRLPLYLRTLTYMQKDGLSVTSSKELAARLGLGSAQVRKDLSRFGKFGKQGTGYEIGHLRRQLEKILHVDRVWPMALVGAGALGQAIVHYGGFRERGFYVACVFDNDPAKVGSNIGDLVVMPPSAIPEQVAKNNLKIGIIAVPSAAAQAVADTLCLAGIRAILNYTPISIKASHGAQAQQIDPAVYLQNMTFYIE